MDMQDNKTSLQDAIKRFALKTTASAMLVLSAETASAAPCPPHITGSALAGMTCDFDTFTPGSSVTVENGGTVGGINMLSYTPSPPSHITINAGGVISDTSTNPSVGIALSNSSLSDGISNNGTISMANGVGIALSSSSIVSGGISNSGLISTGAPSIFVGSSSTVTGGISNSGVIRSDLFGMIINNSSTVTGGISNSGLISSNVLSIVIGANSTVTEGISNSGVISSNVLGMIISSSSNVAGGISNSGSINSGALGILVGVNSTVSGAISNSGAISATNGTAIGVFSSSTIAGGISNSGTIQGGIYAIGISPGSSVNTIDILGQHARIIGAVEAPNTTVNIANGGVFTSEGSYNVNVFNIGSNALFNMAGAITAITVNNSGTLAIADPLQTITGNYVQLTGSTFQTELVSLSDYGQLAVTGVADLSQSGDISVQVGPNALFRAGDTFSNIISANTLIAPTNGFSVSDNSYIWNFIPSLNNLNNGVNLTAEINPAVYSVCQGTYCQGAVTTIIGQIAAGNPIFSPYAALSTADALRIAASQATPELTNENMQVIQLITRSVLGVVPMWDTLYGSSTGDPARYQTGKIWVKPYGASMTQNERNTVDGFNASAYGAVIGKEVQVTNDWLFGGGFAAGGDRLRGKSVLNGQVINSNTYQGLLYGVKQFPSHLYVAGQGLIGYAENDTTRSIPLYASTAKGSFDNWFTDIRVEAGWNTYVFGSNFVFTPVIDANYLFINQGSYREFGSPMDLWVANNNNSSLILGAYGKGAYHLATLNTQQKIALTGYAGFAGDVINSQPQLSSAFVAGGPNFSTFGVQFGGVVFRSGAGLTFNSPNSPLIVELKYDLQSGNNAYSNIGAATIKYIG